MLHTGKLTDSHRAVDGIFGFGQQSLSVISQLSSQRVTPRTFSHCLKGNDDGGGILVLGEIVEPDMVYTPLVPSMYVISIHLIEAVLLFIYRACYNCSRNDLFTFSGFWNCQFLSHDSFCNSLLVIYTFLDILDGDCSLLFTKPSFCCGTMVIKRAVFNQYYRMNFTGAPFSLGPYARN